MKYKKFIYIGIFIILGILFISIDSFSSLVYYNYDRISNIQNGKGGDEIYLYNDSTTMYLNESRLNSTITNLGGGTDTKVKGDEIYLYNDSTTMYLNESKLNSTIEELDTDTDTTYNSDELYINEITNVFYLNESRLNSTISYWFDTEFFNATAIKTVGGTGSGSLDDINAYNGDSYNVTEQAISPGLDLRVNFTNLPSTINQVIFRYKNTASESHISTLYLWNYDESDWETYGTAQSIEDFTIFEFSIFDADEHIQNGTLLIRVFIDTNGNPSHKHYFDWITVSRGRPTPSASEVDPFSYHKDENINASGYNGTFDYLIGDGSQLTGITGGIWDNVSGVATYQGNASVNGSIDFNNYKAIAMSCDNGATMPASPSDGQWFLHTPVGRKILYQYDANSSLWIPLHTFGNPIIYVNGSSGTDDINNGWGVGANSFATIQYALDTLALTGSPSTDATINIAEGTYNEALSHMHAYGITLQGEEGTPNETGTITTYSTGVETYEIYDSSKSWTPNDYRGYFIKMTSGTANGEILPIEGNNATTLFIVSKFTATPSASDTFKIYRPSTIISDKLYPLGKGAITINTISLSGSTSRILQVAIPESAVTSLYSYIHSSNTDVVYNGGGSFSPSWSIIHGSREGLTRTVLPIGSNSYNFIKSSLIYTSGTTGTQYGIYAEASGYLKATTGTTILSDDYGVYGFMTNSIVLNTGAIGVGVRIDDCGNTGTYVQNNAFILNQRDINYGDNNSVNYKSYIDSGYIEKGSDSYQLQVEADTATQSPLILKGAVSQSANLEEWQDSSGSVLGSFYPNGKLKITSDTYFPFEGISSGDVYSGVAFDTYSDQNWHRNTFRVRRSRGTLASPTTVSNSDASFLFDVFNHDGTAWRRGGQFGSYVDAAPSGGQVPMRWFWNTVDATGTTNTGMTIKSSGYVGIGNAATTPEAQLEIIPNAATVIGSIIRGAANQSANLLEARDSSSNVLSGKTSGGHNFNYDNIYSYFGTGNDAGIWYDGTDMHVDPQLVGSGDMIIDNGLVDSVDGFAKNGVAGISDSSSYWLCTANDCSTTCQVTISGGIITGCV